MYILMDFNITASVLEVIIAFFTESGDPEKRNREHRMPSTAVQKNTKYQCNINSKLFCLQVLL